MTNMCLQLIRRAGLCLCLAVWQVTPAWAEDFTGIVYPSRDLALSLGVGGLVAAVNVKVGQSVRAGEVLIGLDEAMSAIELERRRVVWEDRSELTALTERVAIVGQLHDNAVKLFELTGGASQEDIQKLKLELADTRGRIEQIKARKQREELEYRAAEREQRALRLTAPAAGVVTRVDLEVGEWAKPGDNVLLMADTSKCYLRVSVSDAAARRLKRDMKLPLLIEGNATETMTGRLGYIAPVADAASGLVELRIFFDNPRNRVRPGATGRVRIVP